MNIFWTPRAEAELDAHHDYIARDQPSAAEEQVRAILGAVASLRTFPNQGRPGRVAETRELVIPRTPYIAAYAVIEESIFILALLHGAQQWPRSF